MKIRIELDEEQIAECVREHLRRCGHGVDDVSIVMSDDRDEVFARAEIDLQPKPPVPSPSIYDGLIRGVGPATPNYEAPQ